MTIEEIRQLLALASAYDPRNSPTKPAERNAKAHAWHLALDDINYQQAKAAVIAHYRTSTDSVMPADIIRWTIPEPTTNSGILTQQPPCEHCGLQPSHRIHLEHPYRPGHSPAPLTDTAHTHAIDWHDQLQQARQERADET